MDFLRSYFFRNEPGTSDQLYISWPFLSSKIYSPIIKTLERHFFKLSECHSNVLITGDERNVHLIRGSFLKK